MDIINTSQAKTERFIFCEKVARATKLCTVTPYVYFWALSVVLAAYHLSGSQNLGLVPRVLENLCASDISNEAVTLYFRNKPEEGDRSCMRNILLY